LTDCGDGFAPDCLIRHTVFETRSASRKVTRVPALPLETKLACVGGDHLPSGEAFAQWIEFSIANKNISEDELVDVIVEYVRNPKLKEKSELEDIDGLTWWTTRKEFDGLWKVVPKVPRAVATELVRRLPVRASFGIGYEFPEEILKWIERSPYLAILLWREDVEFTELRRRVFSSTGAVYDKWVKAAAAGRYFNLSSAEFGELLKGPKELIRHVAHSDSVSPVYLDALEDRDIGIPGSAKRRAQKLTGSEREYEVTFHGIRGLPAGEAVSLVALSA
jgi:hypothetical protein